MRGATSMTGRFVLDISVVMAWCFAETSSGFAAAILDLLSDHQALVPAVWPLETTNALLVAERRKRIPRAHALRFLHLLNSLPISVEQDPIDLVFGENYVLAQAAGLSSYDASYLALAIRESVPLATLDDALRKAARKFDVRIMEP